MYRAHNPSAPGMDYSTYRDASDSHTTVSYRHDAGYFERVGGSCMGIFVGVLILLSAFPVLFLNEGRAVQTAQSLDEGLNSVESLTSAYDMFDSYNNKLVHLNGKLKTDLALTDVDFGISLYAVKLQRHVQMYQWVEHETKREYNEGDRTRIETTYSYSKEWKTEVVDSGRFNVATTHQNPNSFPIQSTTKEASPVLVGSFQLSEGLVSKVGDFNTLQLRRVPAHRDDLKLLENYFYRSKIDPYSPQVGDLRISFSYAGLSGDNEFLSGPHEVSIVAKQDGFLLKAYQTEAGDRLEFLYSGKLSAKEIFQAEHSSNTMLTWLLRLVGWCMIFVGLQIMMAIVRQLVSFIPIVRDLVGLATSIIAFSMATFFALVTIAIGWLRYRPLLAFAIFVAAVVPIILSRQKGRKQKKKHDDYK